MALAAVRAGRDLASLDRGFLDTLKLEYVKSDSGSYELKLNGEFPGAALRTAEVAAGASRVATQPVVRDYLLGVQRGFAGGQLVVMEGRDIGTVIFPDAVVKIFLTASPEERARRRLVQDGGNPSEEEIARVAAEIAARDKADSSRPVSPLRRAEDAMLIDNSKLTLPETISLLCEKIRRKMVLPYRVPYADTDQMGVVYYANYFEYFERFRNELLRACGHPYRVLEQEGIAMPVIEAVCRYKASARYDDELDITGFFAEASGVKVKIVCRIYRAGQLLVEGHTVHACVDMKTGRPTRPPRFVRDLLEPEG